VRTSPLTEDELSRLVVARDRWLAAGVSTESADRPTANAAVAEAYAAIGEPSPAIAWLDSPLAGVVGSWMVRTALTNIAKPGPKDPALRDQLRDQLGDQLGGQLRDQLGDQLRGQLRGQLRDQLWGQLRGQLGGQLGDQLGDQLWGQLRGQLWVALYGQHDLPWLAFYAFPEAELQVTYKPDVHRLLAAETAIAESSGWWWPMKGVCILTERPTVLHRDAQGRLHCGTGPAIAYPDGWGVHAWHGLRVPPDLLDGWDHRRILSEPNTEVRRAAIEVGWDRFVLDAGLTSVHEAADPGNPGQRLALYDVPQQIYGVPVRVLLCTNGSPERDGTRHRFGLTVPASIGDAVSAGAWTYGLDAKEYAGMERRT
jgi:hypothetical protein